MNDRSRETGAQLCFTAPFMLWEVIRVKPVKLALLLLLSALALCACRYVVVESDSLPRIEAATAMPAEAGN